jgi:exonuclease III
VNSWRTHPGKALSRSTTFYTAEPDYPIMRCTIVVPVLVGIFILWQGAGHGAPRSILIDGRFDDWTGCTPLYTDPAGDGSSRGIDVRSVWMSNDTRFLYIRFDLGDELPLQSRNKLVLYLDTDGLSRTGKQVNGIGADLSWHFGERQGFLHAAGGTIPFNAYDVGMVTAPTTTSDRFEMEVLRDATVRSDSPLFPSTTIHWVLRDEVDATGDSAPDKGETASYTFDRSVLKPYRKITLKKDTPGHIRIVTYNVLLDGLSLREDSFSRILKALCPDVLCFQEIVELSVKDTLSLVSGMLGGTWHARKYRDCVTVSRYPITSWRPLPCGLATLVDLPDTRYGDDILIINAHLQSGGRDIGRQNEVDAVVSFIRDVEKKGESLTLKKGTPILIVGDLNLVGEARQLHTLISGDIRNEKLFGPDSLPDWDSSPMTDLIPLHIAEPEAYTWWWKRGRRGISPGRLDYVIYTDSAASVAKSFVLRTESMSDADLAGYGLRRDDTSTASDHLPVVADFIIGAAPALTATVTATGPRNAVQD